MRYRRPEGSGRTGPWLALVWLGVLALLLSACGGAAYAKAAHADQAAYGGMPGAGEPEAEAPAAPSPPPPADKEEAAPYGVPHEVEEAPVVAASGVMAPGDATLAGRPAGAAAPSDLRTAQREGADKNAAQAAPAGEQRDQPSQIASDVAPIQQMLIYTAQLHLAVFETSKSLASVEDLARELGGFLAHRADNQITIRVPVARFDEAMKRICGQGDVLSRNVQVEDVTEQFLDISLRLRNARQVRDRIAALLASAKTVEESLKVEQELKRLSEEIERLEGRIKYLSDRARYSTITVTFEPVRTDDVNPNRGFQLPFPWLADLGLGRLMTLR